MSFPDIALEHHGSVVLLQPLTVEAREWLEAVCDTEPWMWQADGLAVDQRYVFDILEGLEDAGFAVGGAS